MDGEADILADMLRSRPVAEAAPPSGSAATGSAGPAIVAAVLVLTIGGASILGGLRLAETLVADMDTGNAGGLVKAEAVYALAVYLPIMIGGLIGGLAMRSQGMTLGARAPVRAALGILLGAGGLLAATGFAWLAGVAQSMPSTIGATALAAGTLLILLQTASEEILFRGWLQPVLAARMPGWAAVTITAALFAALHLLGGVRAPMSLLNLFLGGLLFGLLALRTGGLAAPIAAHFAWNWSETILLGLTPNPGASGYGAIWNLDLVGMALWGGSDEGLNVSLGMAAALVALVLAVRRPAVD